jgi:hypothetical protein
MVKAAKKMRVWTKMGLPLVRKPPKSTWSWHSRPGERSTNSTTPTTTGPQSTILTTPADSRRWRPGDQIRSQELVPAGEQRGVWVRGEDVSGGVSIV